MNIVYVANTCSREKYQEYVESKGARVSQQAQKYNLLLAEGFAENGVTVDLLSTRPINRALHRKIWFKKEKETVNGVAFTYLPFLNLSLFRSLFLFFGIFFRILFAKKKKKETVVVCDALNIVAAMAVCMAAKIRGFKTIGIITDVPCHRAQQEKLRLRDKMNLSIMKKFSSYLFLTEQMNDIINVKQRSYLVLEGHADQMMKNVPNLLVDKTSPKVCLYAGSLRRVYGIKMLVEGFLDANIPNTELHIYGDGDYAEEIREISDKALNVKYLGVASNQDVVKAELRATLLINPRPTNEDYTKYSFPSKNMEYMASGTPVLTTRLPGMPKDHEPYVFIIEKETVEGIKNALERVFQYTVEELHEFGQKAKNFVLTEKNNYAQAKKVLKFINNTFAIGREKGA